MLDSTNLAVGYELARDMRKHYPKEKAWKQMFARKQQGLIRLVTVLKAQLARQKRKEAILARMRKVPQRFMPLRAQRNKKIALARLKKKYFTYTPKTKPFPARKWGPGAGRGAGMYAARVSDPEWVKFAKKHRLRL